MLENKHYGRQIVLSLFVTVFLLAGLLYLSVRFLIPLYQIDQEQIYNVLIRMFPILIGLVMIEIGVLVARRRDEDYVDEVDKLPPNAYDKPLYTLPGDDPTHMHSDEMTFGQAVVKTEQPNARTGLSQNDQARLENQSEPVTVAGVAPVAPMVEISANTPSYDTGFDSILTLELENSVAMEYDLSLALIALDGPQRDDTIERILSQSTDRAYSYRMDDGTVALILPFYNSNEAEDYLTTLAEECTGQLNGCTLSIGYASRNGRSIDADTLLEEARRELGDNAAASPSAESQSTSGLG